MGLGETAEPQLDSGWLMVFSQLGRAGTGRRTGTVELRPSCAAWPPPVNLTDGAPADLTLPKHLETMPPEMLAGDPTTRRVSMVELRKAKHPRKRTSIAQMSTNRGRSSRNPPRQNRDACLHRPRGPVHPSSEELRRVGSGS